MTKDYQERSKFFYAVPTVFPDWPFKSRLAIGMRFSDFKAIKADKFRFKVKDKMYEISRHKALMAGKTFKLPFGSLPNLIPIELFTQVSDQTGRATPLRATESH